MGAGATWLKATWGRFRNKERAVPTLSRPELGGAWEMWRYMVQEAGDGADPERVRSFLAGLGADQQRGAQAFAGWIKDNAEELQRAAASRGAGDGAHTTDAVTAQLTR